MLDGYSMTLDSSQRLGLFQIDPAPGESCSGNVQVKLPRSRSRINLAIHFAAADASELDGASGLLDAAALFERDDVADEHWVAMLNAASGSKMDPVLADHPDVSTAYIDGVVTWKQLDATTAHMGLSTICWQREPGSPDPDKLDCQTFKDAWIEFSCDYEVSSAGPVGVASWVTSPAGETLCVMPD